MDGDKRGKWGALRVVHLRDGTSLCLRDVCEATQGLMRVLVAARGEDADEAKLSLLACRSFCVRGSCASGLTCPRLHVMPNALRAARVRAVHPEARLAAELFARLGGVGRLLASFREAAASGRVYVALPRSRPVVVSLDRVAFTAAWAHWLDEPDGELLPWLQRRQKQPRGPELDELLVLVASREHEEDRGDGCCCLDIWCPCVHRRRDSAPVHQDAWSRLTRPEGEEEEVARAPAPSLDPVEMCRC